MSIANVFKATSLPGIPPSSEEVPDESITWRSVLEVEFGKRYMYYLRRFLCLDERACQDAGYPERSLNIFPECGNIFRAFHVTPLRHVRVVILGQDPYHQHGKADGLAFSVPDNGRPRSLSNILSALKSDSGEGCGEEGDASEIRGCLSPWAQQGVLLLNSVLTVRQSCAGSHKGWGWEIFTDNVIKCVSEKQDVVVFLLWGREAREKKSKIDCSKHKVLCAPHPASRGDLLKEFKICRHFSKANRCLREKGICPIDWLAGENPG